MNYRMKEILPIKTLDSSGTILVDVNLKDVVSALIFEYKNTRGSTTVAGHLLDCITNISLVDGSTIIFSLNGREIHALDYWDRKESPFMVNTNVTSVQGLASLRYNFGRKLWDPLLAFDPKKYSNPQLSISFDKTKFDASSSAHYLRIMALCFDEKAVSPMGFLRSREHYSYTCGAQDSYEDIELPIGNILRKIMVRGYYAAAQLWTVAHHILIDEDSGKHQPFDEDLTALMKWINGEWPLYKEELIFSGTNTTMSQIVTPDFGIVVAGMLNVATAPPIIGAVPAYSTLTIDPGATANGLFEVSGYNPHSTIVVPFGDQDDPTDWYDTTKIGTLLARITAGSSATNGKVAVVTQELQKT